MQLIKAARPLNLLILFLTQLIAVYFLGFGNSWKNLIDKPHLILFSITQLCAIFGYLFNDVMDQTTDSVNRPKQWYISSDKLRKSAFFISIFCAGSALLLAFTWNYTFGVIISLVILLLFFYNIFLKRLPIIGNIIVALLSAFSIFIFRLYDPNVNTGLIVMFSFNAFGIHLIREIIKDAEDNDGDNIAGYKTFTILAGFKATRYLIMGLTFLFILGYSSCLRIIMARYFTPPLSYVFLTYNILCVALPLFHLLARIQVAHEKSDYTYLSKVALYIMITGTLSMLFF